MPTALFLSPHLDDVVFSCGGLAAQLADAGWNTVLATAFTRSVVPATGFALACQLDKGLPPDEDYMALRRAEDRQAAAIIGFGQVQCLDLPEAPHRGYGSAAELFAELKAGDEAWRDLAVLLKDLVATTGPDLVLAPQALGGHVDHRHTVRAVLEAIGPDVCWYRDVPYAIRHPEARPDPMIGSGLPHTKIDIAGTLERKAGAACAYASQIGFQFGGAANTAASLRAFAQAEAGGHGSAECFIGTRPQHSGAP